MKYRKLTVDGDYSFGNNIRDYVEGKEAVSLAIKSKLLLFYNEWWENKALGIPIFQSILGQVKNQNLKIAISNLVTERIKEIPQVLSVNNVEIDFTKRNAEITLNCTIENEGEIEIEVSL